MEKLTFILFVLLITQVKAQTNDHYLTFGLGYSYQTVKDDALSPVSYSGSLAHFRLGYYDVINNWISSVEMSGYGGIQKPDVAPELNPSSTYTGLGRMIYYLAYKPYTYNNYEFYTGVVSHNTFDYRLHNRYSNSRNNFCGLASFGFNFLVRKPFKLWNNTFDVQYNLIVPFGTYYMRPGYIKPFFNDEVGSKGFAFWGDFFQLDSRTDLLWQLNNGNLLKLSYRWEYASLQVLNPYQAGSQNLSLSIIFKF